MKEPTEITVSVNDRFFTLDIAVRDDELIESVISGLEGYITKGFPIKVRYAYVTFTGSQEVSTKLISRSQQLDEWKSETKQAISTLLRR